MDGNGLCVPMDEISLLLISHPGSYTNADLDEIFGAEGEQQQEQGEQQQQQQPAASKGKRGKKKSTNSSKATARRPYKSQKHTPEQLKAMQEARARLPEHTQCPSCSSFNTRFYDFNGSFSSGKLGSPRFVCKDCNVKHTFGKQHKPRKRRSRVSDGGAGGGGGGGVDQGETFAAAPSRERGVQI